MTKHTLHFYDCENPMDMFHYALQYFYRINKRARRSAIIFYKHSKVLTPIKKYGMDGKSDPIIEFFTLDRSIGTNEITVYFTPTLSDNGYMKITKDDESVKKNIDEFFSAFRYVLNSNYKEIT